MIRAALVLLIAAAAAPAQAEGPPAAITAENIPAIPPALIEATRPYLEYRSAAFEGWDARTGKALILTRFGGSAQAHEVAAPLGARRQITFEAEPLARITPARRTGDVTVVQKDIGGSEFWQLYRLDQGRLMLLTDGKSRNEINAWTHDGRLLAYSSTRRNGTDTDLYLIDPRRPGSDRMLAQLKGGGWRLEDFAPDGRTAIVANGRSVAKTDLFRLDVASGQLTPIGDHTKSIAYRNASFAPDGTLWIISDEGSDFARLGTLDPASGRFSAVSQERMWDVSDFAISEDGRTIAYTVNEAGVDRLKLLDIASRRVRQAQLPAGTIGRLDFRRDGALGFTLASARSPSDLYVLDPATLAVTRWTESETGGLDPSRNVEPELIVVKSFDGETVSGLLYRPDPQRFPGKRPLLISIHGGPEGQATAGFLGRANYLLNEKGIALFLPNVRGSTGFGKRFVGLDNGPFKREDTVKDIGAFLDRLAADPGIDPARIAESGGSYGGYMCYATAIRYGARLKAADCIVAISNFVTFLENTQGYRRDLRRVEYGDERDPAQRAKLMEISPLTRVKDLRIPLLVQTGGNDPRVPPSEAAQMVAAVRANGVPVSTILAANEGHGFRKKENVDYAFWAEVMFWDRWLLGAQ
jgi:dipeptidyl aminopeptidase/acylaminoacyl peptidase